MASISRIYAGVTRASEELRAILLSTVRLDWSKGLPVIPLTISEVKVLARNRHQRDELVDPKVLTTLKSESTNTIITLDISREMVMAALAGLRDNHKARINLFNILSGTRYKYPFRGILIPPKRHNEGGEQGCGAEDSREHMVSRSSLKMPENKEPEFIDFAIDSAAKTQFKRLGGPKPMFLE